MADRLDSNEIIVLRALAKRGATGRAITLTKWQRIPAASLWRRGAVEIWYRQSPDTERSLQGPYYTLSVDGARLASFFL